MRAQQDIILVALMDGKKTGEGQDICYCEKGIEPKGSPDTEYRCPKCGGIRWPKEMGGEPNR
jgi:Zn finger protein HypA/HybF involved in hydrogenase expression